MMTKRDSSVKNKPFQQKAYSITFLVIVFSIFLSQLFTPGITLDTIPEKYLWKKDLIEKYRKFKFGVGDKVFSGAVVGKEGWLFYTGEMSLRNYQKIDPLNISNIKKLVGVLNQIDATVRSYGGTLLVVVPPDKSTVYPQYMPDEIPVIGSTVSLDRLIERVGAHGDFSFLDLRPALIRASETSQVYYKTDTHWNCLGAYYAYEEIMSGFEEDLNLHSYALNDFEITSLETGRFDIATMMEANIKEEMLVFTPKFKTAISTERNYVSDYDVESLRVVRNSDQESPNLMVFHDSFYDVCLGSFIELTFGRTISISYGDVELVEMLNIIEKEKPDVVIVEFAERFMDYFLWHLYE